MRMANNYRRSRLSVRGGLREGAARLITLSILLVILILILILSAALNSWPLPAARARLCPWRNAPPPRAARLGDAAHNAGSPFQYNAARCRDHGKSAGPHPPAASRRGPCPG